LIVFKVINSFFENTQSYADIAIQMKNIFDLFFSLLNSCPKPGLLFT